MRTNPLVGVTALFGLLLVISACDPGTATQQQPTADSPCPITVAAPGAFTPEPPFAAASPNAGMAWYGTPELWTVLEIDGQYRQRKSVWWSENFPGGDIEERPDLHVTHRRVDNPGPPDFDNGGNATNAYTTADGWFMIATIDPDQAGCWQVEASYKGATLSYVYLVP